MHIKGVDLNRLGLFDVVYRTRNFSRVTELLELTQPAASQGLTHLRLLIKTALFMREPAVQMQTSAPAFTPFVSKFNRRKRSGAAS